MPVPTPPINVVATVDTKEQITVSWDYDPTWFAFDGDDGSLGGFNEGLWYSGGSIDHFEIQLTRDGNGWINPNGGPKTVTYDGSGGYSGIYGKDDTADYYTTVGTGSLFKFRVRAVNSDGASAWVTSSTVTTGLYSVSSVTVSPTSSSKINVSWTIEDPNTDGHHIRYREDGTQTWSEIIGLAGDVESETIGSLSQDKTYEIRVENYTEYTTSQSRVVSASTFLNGSRNTSTHSSSASSLSRSVVDLIETVGSYSGQSISSSLRVVDVNTPTLSNTNPIDSTSERGDLNHQQRESESSELIGTFSSSTGVIDLLIESVSHSAASESDSGRSSLTYAIRPGGSHSSNIDTNSIGVIDLSESVESHSKQFRSSIYNDRTSLELIDQEINWDKDEAAWYTDWFQETKLLGSEDTLAAQSFVIDNAKEPAARVFLQYSESGDEVDHESKPVRLGRNQSVEKFSGVPVDEDGYYRLKITEYSGYNSLYEINTAIIH